MKKVPDIFKLMVAVLNAILGLSTRKVRGLAVRLVVVLLASNLLGIAINSDHKIATTMVILLSTFGVAIIANAVATYVSYRDGIRIGRLENGLRAYRLWRRIQASRAFVA